MNLLKILNKFDQAKAIPLRMLIIKIFRKTIDIIKLKIKLRVIGINSVYKKYYFEKNNINFSIGLKIIEFLDNNYIKLNNKNTYLNNENLADDSIDDNLKKQNYSECQKKIILDLADNYINHTFNLLGSGWVNVTHNNNYKGFHGFHYDLKFDFKNTSQFVEKCLSIKNQSYSSKLMSLLPKNYILIDWQRDFRSGYRWSELKWNKLLKIAEQKGAEIKIPWEIGRMQHLFSFYQAWLISNKNEKYLQEFQYQIIDFIASNPPGFGLQWFNSMEVAIRASNWILTLNSFKNSGALFIPDFEDLIINSIIAHADFIFNNLEWSDGMRGNHYFSNITGLIFISIFLNGNYKSNKWLEFSINELLNETKYQFYDDGGNFEHSTAYHLFVVEMLIYSLSVITDISDIQKEALLKNRKIKKYLEYLTNDKLYFSDTNVSNDKDLNYINNFKSKLNKIFDFSINLLNNNKEAFYTGDMDSGYFFRFKPVFKYLIDEINNEDSESDDKESDSELFLKSIENEKNTKCANNLIFNLNDYSELFSLININYNIKTSKNQNTYYNDFGLYVFRKTNYMAYMTFGKIDKRSKGGHSHNDLLSLNLSVNGMDFLIEPGTYNYTAIPELRNKFRSTSMHNTLQLEKEEQNDFIPGSAKDLFWLKPKAELNLIKYTENEFIASHNAFEYEHKRHLVFENNKIKGIDYCNSSKIKFIRFYLHENVEIIQIDNQTIKLENAGNILIFKVKNEAIDAMKTEISPFYGEIKKSNLILVQSLNAIIEWEFEII